MSSTMSLVGNFARWNGTRQLAGVAIAFAGVFMLAGCADSGAGEPSMEQRQDAAMKDPFSYGPEVPAAGSKRPVPPVAEPAGKDDSVKSEWQRFWNP